MKDTEFRAFVQDRFMRVLTARMTRKQIEPIVEEIVTQWQNDIFEAWKLGEQTKKS